MSILFSRKGRRSTERRLLEKQGMLRTYITQKMKEFHCIWFAQSLLLACLCDTCEVRCFSCNIIYLEWHATVFMMVLICFSELEL